MTDDHLLPLADTDDWRTRATCRPPRIGPPIPISVFFPEKGESTATAKAICAVCPSREECLTDSLVTIDRHGVRGGKSERQRRQLRRQKECHQCGRRFTGSRATVKYCSDRCRDAAHFAQQRASAVRTGKVIADAKHGTRSCYVMGCRRPECRQADADYQAARYQKTRAS